MAARMMVEKKKSANNHSVVKTIFFGNYFYGICAVALAMEANLQQLYPLNKILFYILLFSCTVLYYTIAYIQAGQSTTNKRLIWYGANRRFIKRSQQFFFLVSLLIAVFLLQKHYQAIFSMPLYEWLLIGIFPLLAAFYYGIGYKPLGKINLRSIGWLKPFLIGFIWAGMVTVYPIIMLSIESNKAYEPTLIGLFLFIKNMMFVSVLCIMFDIKDYADDYNKNLKTFVTQFGLRKTIFELLIPLSALGLGSFLVYGYTRDFSAMKIIMNTIPFIAMILVAYSMWNRRNIFYYLIIIDGLMLVKAVCGMIAVTYF
jgi:hypothetical protein